ncbi:MAG: TetR/AcrR family transcriptional regulator [Desulfobacterales bacterium]|nr:TetR/AcrR family transcriptional regulator [Desulfobacterales bacterium]
MRTKDEQKKEALFKATVKLVNEIGFAYSSVSKIAKEAGVSPSTLYVFFQNKEDLLISTYVNIKRAKGRAILSDFNDSLPIRDILRKVWRNTFAYISHNPDKYQFIEQFANSPYVGLVDQKALEKHYSPIIEVIQKGIEQKIIKKAERPYLVAFLFQPISYLANPRSCEGLELSAGDIDRAFDMAWDAIKR